MPGDITSCQYTKAKAPLSILSDLVWRVLKINSSEHICNILPNNTEDPTSHQHFIKGCSLQKSRQKHSMVRIGTGCLATDKVLAPTREAPTPSPKIISILGTKNEPKNYPSCTTVEFETYIEACLQLCFIFSTFCFACNFHHLKASSFTWKPSLCASWGLKF